MGAPAGSCLLIRFALRYRWMSVAESAFIRVHLRFHSVFLGGLGVLAVQSGFEPPLGAVES